MAAVPVEVAGREATAAPTALARAPARRALRGDDGRGARRLEREGQARARLGACPRELPRGLSRGVQSEDDDGFDVDDDGAGFESDFESLFESDLDELDEGDEEEEDDEPSSFAAAPRLRLP